MLYVALGDSITAGELASNPARAYPSVVVRNLQTMRRKPRGVTTGAVLAEPGWTSMDLLAAVREQLPVTLQHAGAVSVWIGGDNLVTAGLAMARGASRSVLTQSLSRYASSLHGLLALLRTSFQGPIVVCTQYNPFPNTAIAAQGIDALNETTARVASTVRARLAPVHAWFDGNQSQWIAGYRTGSIRDALTSASPPVHPNDLGHQAIAGGLTPLLVR